VPGSAGLIVERLVAAVDVGRVLNPGLVRQRIESGLMFGLAAAVGATTRYRRGLAGARRLAEIGLPDLSRSPQVEIEILESERDPGGVEELAVPPVAPALANALYTVTSLRIRRLPLSTKALP
ncbi:MAG: molybdopterin-dependent oxidoreductase, partial [Sphingopyxis sp.]|nr:molybdopterin-dependent oxidoreductase [Sphingopyxis sp.]